MQHIYSRLTRWVWVLLLAGQLVSLSAKGQTQAPGIQWQRFFESASGNDATTDMQAVNAGNGGYVILQSYTKAPPTVTKISTDGASTYWSTTLSVPDSLKGYKVENYRISSIITTSSSDYALAGYYNSKSGSYYNYFIVRISNTGQLTKIADFTANVFVLTSFIESSDGGFLLSGWTHDGYPVPQAYKFDANGKLQWEVNPTTMPQITLLRRSIKSVTLSPENDFILAGDAASSPVRDMTYGWMGKLSKDGKTYEANYGTRSPNEIYSIQMTQDKSGYITTMGKYRDQGQLLATPSITKLSLTGDSLWSIPNPNNFGHVISLKNGNYLVSGNSSAAPYDIKLLNIKEGGTINWQRTLSGSQYDELSTAIATPDGGYLLAGITYSQDGDFSSRASSPADTPAGWLIKIAPEVINEPIAQEQAPPMQWNKVPAQSASANSNCIKSLIASRPAGGYLVLNIHENSPTTLAQLSENGTIAFIAELPVTYKGIDFKATADGNFVILGSTTSNKAFVRKIDQDGNTIFEKFLPQTLGPGTSGSGGSLYEAVEKIFAFSDNSIVVTGYYTLRRAIYPTYSRLDQNGNEIPSRINYEGASSYFSTYLAETEDGGTIEANGFIKYDKNGQTVYATFLNPQIIKPSVSRDGFICAGWPPFVISDDIIQYINLFKAKPNGTYLWTRSIPLRGRVLDLITEADGSIVIVSGSETINNDYLLRKFNSEGVLLWQQQVGGSKSDVAQRVVKDNDGGYVISGISQSSDLPGQSLPDDGLNRPWVVKFGTAAPAALSLTTSYNCTTGQLTVQTQGGNSAPVEFQIAGLRGWSTDNSFTVPSYQRVGTTFTIQARQSGNQQSITFTSACTTPTPPPTPTPGQFGLVAPAYDCVSGKLTANYVNSNQVATEFRIVGLRDWEASPEFTVPSYQLVGTSLTIEARLASGQTASYPFTTTCVSTPPISETSGLFTIVPVYDCNTGLLTLTPINSNGTPIEYQIAGLRGWSTNNAFGIPAYQRMGTTFTIQARQTGNTVAIVFTSACATAPPSTTTTTPPSSTTTSPPSSTTSTPPSSTTVALSLPEPTVICNDPKLGNQLTIQTKGGNGSAIEYRVIGLRDWSGNNVFPFPYYQSRNTSFTLCARQSGTEVLRVYVTNCPHPAREAVPDAPDGWQTTVRPNPVSERFIVEVVGASGQAVHFQLTDMAGRTVSERQTHVTTDNHQEPFTISKQATGLYLIQVTTQHQRQTLKIMKH